VRHTLYINTAAYLVWVSPSHLHSYRYSRNVDDEKVMCIGQTTGPEEFTLLVPIEHARNETRRMVIHLTQEIERARVGASDAECEQDQHDLIVRPEHLEQLVWS
jgi:hypothetical protein